MTRTKALALKAEATGVQSKPLHMLHSLPEEAPTCASMLSSPWALPAMRARPVRAGPSTSPLHVICQWSKNGPAHRIARCTQGAPHPGHAEQITALAENMQSTEVQPWARMHGGTAHSLHASWLSCSHANVSRMLRH